MATPPREGWDGEHAAEYGNKERAERRTRKAQEAGYDTWGEWVEELEAESRYNSICGRARKRVGQPCKRPEAAGVPEKDRGACKKHGGKSPQGRAHPAYKDGSRVETTFPAGILESARQFAEQSPQKTLEENKTVLLHLRNEFLQEIEEASGPGLRAELSDVFQDVQQADDREELQRHMATAFDLVRSGVEADAARGRLLSILEELRATAEAQRRLFVDMHEVVAKPELLALVDRVGQVVDRAVESNLTEDAVREISKRSSDEADFARRLKREIHRDLWSGLGQIVGQSEGPRGNGGPPSRR